MGRHNTIFLFTKLAELEFCAEAIFQKYNDVKILVICNRQDLMKHVISFLM